MKNILAIVLLFVSSLAYAKIYINGIYVDEKDIEKSQEYLRYRAIADMVFEESKVVSLKYYERVLKKFPDDFVSLSRISLIYALKGIPNLSIYYGTNAIDIYKKNPNTIRKLNYIELLVALSVSYATLQNEINAYSYLEEAKKNLSKLIIFKSDYTKANKLVIYAESFYKNQFYKIVPLTNTNYR
ncbi:MAG: hypothetical protein ACK4F9_01885 [Brevinematia bacterium]